MAEESALKTIKHLMGLTDDYTPFDAQLLVHINTALASARRLGVISPGDVWTIDENTTWEDIFGPIGLNEQVKSLIYLKTWLIFDPPNSGFVTKSIEDRIAELEFQIYVDNDPKLPPDTPED